MSQQLPPTKLELFRCDGELFTTNAVLRRQEPKSTNYPVVRKAIRGKLGRTEAGKLAATFISWPKNESTVVSLAAMAEKHLSNWGFRIPTDAEKDQAPSLSFQRWSKLDNIAATINMDMVPQGPSPPTTAAAAAAAAVTTTTITTTTTTTAAAAANILTSGPSSHKRPLSPSSPRPAKRARFSRNAGLRERLGLQNTEPLCVISCDLDESFVRALNTVTTELHVALNPARIGDEGSGVSESGWAALWMRTCDGVIVFVEDSYAKRAVEDNKVHFNIEIVGGTVKICEPKPTSEQGLGLQDITNTHFSIDTLTMHAEDWQPGAVAVATFDAIDIMFPDWLPSIPESRESTAAPFRMLNTPPPDADVNDTNPNSTRHEITQEDRNNLFDIGIFVRLIETDGRDTPCHLVPRPLSHSAFSTMYFRLLKHQVSRIEQVIKRGDHDAVARFFAAIECLGLGLGHSRGSLKIPDDQRGREYTLETASELATICIKYGIKALSRLSPQWRAEHMFGPDSSSDLVLSLCILAHLCVSESIVETYHLKYVTWTVEQYIQESAGCAQTERLVLGRMDETWHKREFRLPFFTSTIQGVDVTRVVVASPLAFVDRLPSVTLVRDLADTNKRREKLWGQTTTPLNYVLGNSLEHVGDVLQGIIMTPCEDLFNKWVKAGERITRSKPKRTWQRTNGTLKLANFGSWAIAFTSGTVLRSMHVLLHLLNARTAAVHIVVLMSTEGQAGCVSRLSYHTTTGAVHEMPFAQLPGLVVVDGMCHAAPSRAAWGKTPVGVATEPRLQPDSSITRRLHQFGESVRGDEHLAAMLQPALVGVSTQATKCEEERTLKAITAHFSTRAHASDRVLELSEERLDHLFVSAADEDGDEEEE